MRDKILILVLAIALSIPVGAFAVGLPGAPGSAEPVLLTGENVDATIIRDEWGVPHIYADDAYSLFYANGYAQAQDRMAQIEILRHVGKGELASLTGASGLELDLVTRRELYTHDERVAAFEALPTEWQEAFQGYADGVNRWINEIRTDPTKLPVEYPALVEFPEDWQVTDTIAIAQYLLDVFGRGGGGGEYRNARVLAQLRELLGDDAGNAAFTDFVWGVRSDTYTTIKPGDENAADSWQLRPIDLPKDLSDLDPTQQEAFEAALSYEDVDDAMMPIHETMAGLGWPFKFGSNAQLLDERFAANGKPLLYGGPQMAYFAPMIPYELGLHGAGFDATGMGVAGAPGVIIGRAAGHSWTVTSGSVDQVDMVVERLVDDYHYEVDGEVREMDCRNETHVVRPGPADLAPSADPNWRPPLPDVVTQEVCRTIHGPVLGRTADGDYAFASYRSYRGDEARSGTLWLQIGTTTDIDDFQDLFETFRFTFNFNYADDDGNIMYMHVGAQPIRDSRLDPRLPMPGWDSSYDWKGFDMGRDLPNVRNPTSGYTVNWNNNPQKHFPTGDMMEKWGRTQRAQLMEEALLDAIDEKGTLTMDDLRAVHEYASTHDPYADDTHPLLLAAGHTLGNASVVDAIEEWAATGHTFTEDPASPGNHYKGFRLYELWRSELQELVFADELDGFVDMPQWDPPSAGDPHAANHGEADMPDQVLIDTLAGDAAHDWCDDINTTDGETCADQAYWALITATEDGTWDDAFPLRMSKFVALGASPAHEIPMTNRPSFQHFYDWGLPEGDERSRNALPPGASGHMNAVDFLMVQGWQNGVPGATPPKHLVDQLQMYVDFEDKPLLFARDRVEAHEESLIVFGDGA